MKSLRYLHASLSQQSQCPLSWVCKVAVLGPCLFYARLRPLLSMRIWGYLLFPYQDNFFMSFTIFQNIFDHNQYTSPSYETSHQTKSSTFPQGAGRTRYLMSSKGLHRRKSVYLSVCSSREGKGQSPKVQGLDCREDALTILVQYVQNNRRRPSNIELEHCHGTKSMCQSLSLDVTS
ncbi:hypothetical protein LAZ67_4001529 [Cordylochernes scorpioides]|uniref:Uncharacterized protein n=1 Tax=Cordylochernes scorpioides TaxID=51811 RepID=A0ABY6KC77_9ARAC|nr:hypothetical protein LAZ67_4001529 [Cordylochernes scorpioides]